MTLQELLHYLSTHPLIVLAYFTLIPAVALLAGLFDEERGHLAPWNYTYAALIYAVSVPGIFALSLDVYSVLIEKRSIFQIDLLTQVLPVASMILTLLIIRRNVDLDFIPGFDRLSGLMMIITAAMIIMWAVDRVRLVVFSRLNIAYVFLIFAALLLIIRYGARKLLSGSKPPR